MAKRRGANAKRSANMMKAASKAGKAPKVKTTVATKPAKATATAKPSRTVRKAAKIIKGAASAPSSSRGVSQAVTKPMNKATRARKKSDDTYNARRRFTREAERYMKKADTVTGAAKSRYERLAEKSMTQAAALYKGKPKGRNKLSEMGKKIGVDPFDKAKAFAAGYKAGKQSVTGKLIARSYERLEKNKQQTRDEMAKDILATDNIGSRFYGGLSEIWTQDEESRQHPDTAITEFFGVDSIADVLEQLEEAGIDIYAADENNSNYKSIQLKIQELIMKMKSGEAA